jgi:rhomboid protease GluP
LTYQLKRNLPIATIGIIILNSIIFSAGLLLGFQNQIISNYGFIPNQLFGRDNNQYGGNDVADDNSGVQQRSPLSSSLPSLQYQQEQKQQQQSVSDSLIRLFTSMFVHANIAHIAFNMFALAYLGGFAETSIGIPRYLAVYIISGIVAALFHSIIAYYILHNGDIVLVGASGAISGVLGIAAAAGNTRAYYWLVLQIIFAVFGSVAAIPIAFTAHVGGFISGVLLTKILIKLERIRRRSRYFLQP